jgi:C-terminal processing protease CtpA/Prc
MLKPLIVAMVLCSGCVTSYSQQSAPPQYRIGVDLFSGTKPSCPIFIGRVYRDSPAAKAGLMPGDQLIAVDGADITDIRDASKRITSRESKPVTLTLRRDEDNAPFSVTVRREEGAVLLRRDGWKLLQDGSLVRADSTDADAEYQLRMERVMESSNEPFLIAFADHHYPVDKQVYYPGFEAFVLDKGNQVIVGGIEDGPASRARVRWGDRIATVNGMDPRGKSAAEIESLLSSTKPASLSLTIARGEAPMTFSFALEQAATVLGENQKKVLNGKIVPLWLPEKYLPCWER